MHARPCFLHAPCYSLPWEGCVQSGGKLHARRVIPPPPPLHGACTAHARPMHAPCKALHAACATRSRSLPRARIPQALRVTLHSNWCSSEAHCMQRESPYQRPACNPHAPGLLAPGTRLHGAFLVPARRRHREGPCIQAACTPPALRLQSAVAAFLHLPRGVPVCMARDRILRALRLQPAPPAMRPAFTAPARRLHDASAVPLIARAVLVLCTRFACSVQAATRFQLVVRHVKIVG